jgi:hypothetical protein
MDGKWRNWTGVRIGVAGSQGVLSQKKLKIGVKNARRGLCRKGRLIAASKLIENWLMRLLANISSAEKERAK